ncbi:MAG: hypothetical protein LBR34_06705 [Prevotella sp.]|jgi:hypothetical protein|nr:hypothetical protein [Prevotella sp.]
MKALISFPFSCIACGKYLQFVAIVDSGKYGKISCVINKTFLTLIFTVKLFECKDNKKIPAFLQTSGDKISIFAINADFQGVSRGC